MPTKLRSFCKINLGLAVGLLRADGFHELATCYQTLALHDFVTVTARPSTRVEVEIVANHPGVPQTGTGDAERNTAWNIVAGALERLGLTAEVEVRIEKRLPVQGGLGAGSANAAAALLGLERELGVSLDSGVRLELAAAVGSDVPLFLLGGTVLGLGRGEDVYPLPDLPELPCVIALPEVGVSTARAFRVLDERLMPRDTEGWGGPRLTETKPADRLRQLSRALAAAWTIGGTELRVDLGEPDPAPVPEPSFTGMAALNRPKQLSVDPLLSGTLRESGQSDGDLAEKSLLALVRTGMENDFEEVVFSEHPPLRSTKRDLMGNGPGTAGSALYADTLGLGFGVVWVVSNPGGRSRCSTACSSLGHACPRHDDDRATGILANHVCRGTNRVRRVAFPARCMAGRDWAID